MASRALFGGPGSRSRSNNLVEFKAGKMTLKGKMCHPDKRKGLLYVHESEDSLMHFCWKDRTTGKVEDDLLIFPDDVTFKHVPQCTTGRVYVLQFNNSSRKFIFWMQEPKTDKDEENCQKVNRYLNSPPTGNGRYNAGGSGSGLTGLPADLSSLGESELQSILGGMSQQQLIQLLGGMGMSPAGLAGAGGLSGLGLGGGSGSGGGGRQRPASSSLSESSPTPLRVQSSPGPRAGAAAAAESRAAQEASATPVLAQRPVTAAPAAAGGAAGTTPPPSGTPAPIQLSDLQSILQNLNVPGSAGAARGGTSSTEPTSAEMSTPASAPVAGAPPSVDLVKTLGSSDVMVPILANKEIQDRLIPFLPTGEILPSSEEELRSTFSSNQYHQALRSFGEALQSGQLGPLLNQFQLSDDAVAAATRGDVEAFARAVQESEKPAEVEKMDESAD